MPQDFASRIGQVEMRDVVTALVLLGSLNVVTNATKWAANKLSGLWRT